MEGREPSPAHCARGSALHVYRNISAQQRGCRDISRRFQRIAKTNSTVLISGESGPGPRELMHAANSHKTRPPRASSFRATAARWPEEVLASERSGTEGAARFTGAKSRESGIFPEADRGTIFPRRDSGRDLTGPGRSKLLRVVRTSSSPRRTRNPTTPHTTAPPPHPPTTPPPPATHPQDSPKVLGAS